MYDIVKEKFFALHGALPTVSITANGRVNIIGEHVDYHLGYVLPFAIDKGITMCAMKDTNLDIRSLDFEDEYADVEYTKGSWQNYMKNAIALLNAKLNVDIKIKMVFGGNLPIGAGVSSSSALCCGFIEVICRLYEKSLSLNEKVNLASEIEHGGGVIGGKMDQYTIFNGDKKGALLVNCRNLSHELIEIPEQWAFILIDTNVKHNLATTEYNTRRKESESGLAEIAKYEPGITCASDLSQLHLENYKSKLSSIQYQRLDHVVNENKRVHEFKKSMASNDIFTAGKLLNASHDSLRLQYEVSCDELDYLQQLAKDVNGIFGSRMMGGGFGGCTLNLVNRAIDEDIALVCQKYKEKFNKEPRWFFVKPAQGLIVHE